MLRERHLSLKLRHTEIRISLLFFAVLVVLFTVDQTSIPQWCLTASAMHEAGHFVLLLAYRCQPSLISVGLFGVRVEQKPTSRLSYMQNFWVSLAGPLVNLISFIVLLATTGWSKAAIVHLVIAVINLLPVESLDGGQALFCLLANRMNSQKAERIVFAVSIIILIPLACFGFTLLIRSGYNFTLFAVSVYLGLLMLFKR